MAKTKYNPAYHPDQATLLLSAEHYTDAELCEYFNIAESTYYDWQNRFPEFREAVLKGKKPTDKLVEASAYKKAVGFTAVEEKYQRNEKGRMVLVEQVRKQIAPDTPAFKFWLTNRCPERWRDKQDHEICGKDGGPIETKDLSLEELLKLDPGELLQRYRAALAESGAT